MYAERNVHHLATNWRKADLNPQNSALCEFAEKLTLNQELMSKDDVENLKRHGFDDPVIHDAAQVIGYFNYITRIADALGVECETFIQPWEADR